ncbi:MAG: NUDIX domain-containing protein [Anaerolineae bacterium]|nr:MAG: NUDIX domain-containing protein [Anaerolineae bacterium]
MIDETWYHKPAGMRERVSAGGVVVRRAAGQILVALVVEAGFSHYILPKGGVKRGETLEQAARREILEEAGLRNLLLLRPLGVRERLNFRKTRWQVTHYFLFECPHPGGRPTDAHHDYRCAWFPLDALPPMFWPEQRALLDGLRPDLESLGETVSRP